MAVFKIHKIEPNFLSPHRSPGKISDQVVQPTITDNTAGWNVEAKFRVKTGWS